jgi:hypothetical protein
VQDSELKIPELPEKEKEKKKEGRKNKQKRKEPCFRICSRSRLGTDVYILYLEEQ